MLNGAGQGEGVLGSNKEFIDPSYAFAGMVARVVGFKEIENSLSIETSVN